MFRPAAIGLPLLLALVLGGETRADAAVKFPASNLEQLMETTLGVLIDARPAYVRSACAAKRPRSWRCRTTVVGPTLSCVARHHVYFSGPTLVAETTAVRCYSVGRPRPRRIIA